MTAKGQGNLRLPSKISNKVKKKCQKCCLIWLETAHKVPVWDVNTTNTNHKRNVHSNIVFNYFCNGMFSLTAQLRWPLNLCQRKYADTKFLSAYLRMPKYLHSGLLSAQLRSFPRLSRKVHDTPTGTTQTRYRWFHRFFETIF